MGKRISFPDSQVISRMGVAYPRQNLQDWFTQQWAILWGRKIEPNGFPWLAGPFGKIKGSGLDLIEQLAKAEDLVINRNAEIQALIPSIESLGLPDEQLSALSPEVAAFYENTGNYELGLTIRWNPLFRIFGVIVNKLFSNRINQLNIPTRDINRPEPIDQEVVALMDPESNRTKYTIWLRSFRSTGRAIYSGVYGTCTLPSGRVCIKAVFPLPNGNATVIMAPSVGPGGELILDSSGKRFGDPGFYFLLNDSNGNLWAQFVGSFRDRLTVLHDADRLLARQILTLWHLRVLRFDYEIRSKRKTD